MVVAGKKVHCFLSAKAVDIKRTGVPDWIRTSGLWLRRPTLYPLSYGHRCLEWVLHFQTQ